MNTLYTIQTHTSVTTSNPHVGVGILVLKEDKVLLGKSKGSHGKGLKLQQLKGQHPMRIKLREKQTTL